MAKHNNRVPNNHFKKDWEKRIKTHFNQPAQKKIRQVRRKVRAAQKSPRPDSLLRPVVRCQTQRYNARVKLGRGFSLAELKAAGIQRDFARTIGISVDHRRVNRSEEGFQANVERLREYRNKLFVYPRHGTKASKAEREYPSEPVQHKGPIMPVSNDVSEVEWVEVTDDIQKRNVYASLQRAWQKKRDAGRLAKRAAEEEEKKK